jgi:transcriptional regulator with XRE-family HTH domain
MRPCATVLSPSDMHEMRLINNWTFRQLSDLVNVTRAQLCEYETGRGRLREDQQRKIKAALLRGVRARGTRIAELIGGRRESACDQAVPA